MSERAKKFWREIADPLAELGILTKIDAPAAVLMAEHYGIARQAAEKLAEEGLTAVDENGAMRKNPLLQVMRDNSAAFRIYAVEFGMTPSARARLHIEQPEQMSLADLLFGEAEVGEDVEYSADG